MTWAAVLLTCLGCYLVKLAGVCVPARVLASPAVQRVAALLPVALLAALVAVQALAAGSQIHLDARLAGLAAATLALLLRAPFLGVVAVAAVVTAGLRALSG